MSNRTLYDLAGADPAFRFSPYCWRTKLALAHKGLSYDTIPWRFTDKEVIAFTGQGQVPVLTDGGSTLHDSQAIAEYLDANYPDGEPLFSDGSRGPTIFIKQWAETTLHPAIAKIVVSDIFKLIDPKDRAYFRETRERIFGKSMEDLAAGRDAALAALPAVLAPLRGTLAAQPFIAGDSPAYADHIVFGALQWGRLTSSTPLLQEDGPVGRWMAALVSRYGLR